MTFDLERKGNPEGKCHLSRWEVGDEAAAGGRLHGCDGLHGHDGRGWCGHGHGNGWLGHHGLLVLGHDGGHRHCQGGQVGDRRRGELTENLHIHCREATLKTKCTRSISCKGPACA